MKPASERKIAVVGLGYVGLPCAVALSRAYEGVLGFDVDERRVATLREGRDWTGEIDTEVLREAKLRFTADPNDLVEADFFIVAVPTPIEASKRPDLNPLRSASRTVGSILRKGDIVVYESTVYPGVTEEVCGPILAEVSGLECGTDFTLGYSPERINPGDREHTFERVVKVVSGQDDATLEVVAGVYGSVVDAGVHRASSIRVAESSKVIENVQRDINIALMNELALIFDRLGIDTSEVLAAAGTKWNFLKFTPGLVGGHCIGVDPYYLTTKAEEVGITPQVILSGRRINDDMGRFVAQATVKEMGRGGGRVAGGRVAVLGLSFKENVPDIRNSKVPDIVSELRSFGATVMLYDPHVDPEDAKREYGLELVGREALVDLDATVFAVAHDGLDDLAVELVEAGCPALIDVKAKIDRERLPEGTRLWRL